MPGRPLDRSFDEIYSRDATALNRYLRRLTLSRTTAEDLLQETFLRLHVQLRDGAEIENVRAWLFRVATHLAHDKGKAQARAQVRERRYEASARVVDIQPALDQRHDVRRALGLLPPRMRQVILLHAEGFSYKELAEITGVEPGYAGVLLQRARAEFKRIFEDHGEQTRDRRPGHLRRP